MPVESSPIFPEEVSILSIFQLPLSQGTTSVVGCCGLWVSWPMCSWCHLPVTRSFAMGGGMVGGGRFTGLQFSSFQWVQPQIQTTYARKLFLAFHDLLSEDFYCQEGPWRLGVGGWFPCLWLSLSGVGDLWNAATLCTASLWLSLNVYQPPRPDCHLCPSGLIFPVGAAPQPFTAVAPTGAKAGSGPCLRLLSLSFPHPVSPEYSDMPTFRCLNEWIHQTYLYVEQGVLC